MTADLEARIGNRSRRVLEMTMALAIMALGVQLTRAPDDVFRVGGALYPLLLIAPALFWTTVFTMLGTARLVIVIINGVWPLSPFVRWWMSAISLGFVWAALTAGYWIMLPATQGFPALVLGPIGFIVEANCLFALSALRAGRRRDK